MSRHMDRGFGVPLGQSRAHGLLNQST